MADDAAPDLEEEQPQLARLRDAVSYLLTRDVNLLSSATVGQAGNHALREAFLRILGELEPTVFCDIGANDGEVSVAARATTPLSEVFAYEANPEIHKRNAARLAEAGVTYLNYAIAAKAGVVEVHVPRTLSRYYKDGEIVPGRLNEQVDTGKGSLLLRDEDATYSTFSVNSHSLDELFKDKLQQRR